MKSFVSFRSLLSVSVVSSSLLLLAGCGAPEGNLPDAQPTPAATPTEAGEVAIAGPNTDGEFYVVGAANAAAPGALVTLTNVDGEQVSVRADEQGAFAAHLWSPIDHPVSIDGAAAVQSLQVTHPDPINVNVATKRGLESVPGIGPALAQKILDYRVQEHLFSEPADLANVNGIGAASVQQMLPWVVTKIDVNTACQTWLEALPLVGSVRAKAIIAWREAHGAFASVDEIKQVPGIDDGVYAAIVPYVKAGHVAPNPGSPLVNVNDADLDTLEVLPGLGYVKAASVIDWRNGHGLFKKVDDLIFVPGIGPDTLDAIRPLVTVGIPDPQVGTFALEGSWHYEDGQGGSADGTFAPQTVLLSINRNGSGVDATVVGAGYCPPNLACAPFDLSASITSSAANGDFTFRLSGKMPSTVGDWSVQNVAASEGTATSSTISAGFVAVNAGRVWQVSLTGYRILD